MGGRGAGEGEGDSRGRVVLVIDSDPELAVALRDRLDRAYVTVCGVGPEDAAGAARACHPCAWMVIGTGSVVAPDLLALLAGQPSLVLWRGETPPGLPRHARTAWLYSELAEAVERAICTEVGGVRLAPGSGLSMPDGRHATNAALEALVAGHPEPLFAPAPHFRTVATALRSHGVALRLSRTTAGGARLVPQDS